MYREIIRLTRNKGKIPTSGAAVKLEAEKDGRIKVVFKAKGKDIYFLQDVDGKPQGIETFKAGADLIAKLMRWKRGHLLFICKW